MYHIIFVLGTTNCTHIRTCHDVHTPSGKLVQCSALPNRIGRMYVRSGVDFFGKLGTSESFFFIVLPVLFCDPPLCTVLSVYASGILSCTWIRESCNHAISYYLFIWHKTKSK